MCMLCLSRSNLDLMLKIICVCFNKQALLGFHESYSFSSIQFTFNELRYLRFRNTNYQIQSMVFFIFLPEPAQLIFLQCLHILKHQEAPLPFNCTVQPNKQQKTPPGRNYEKDLEFKCICFVTTSIVFSTHLFPSRVKCAAWAFCQCILVI